MRRRRVFTVEEKRYPRAFAVSTRGGLPKAILSGFYCWHSKSCSASNEMQSQPWYERRERTRPSFQILFTALCQQTLQLLMSHKPSLRIIANKIIQYTKEKDVCTWFIENIVVCDTNMK